MYASCMQTSIRVDVANRDELAAIAADELGGASLDETLRVLLFEHRSRVAIARMLADPVAHADYVSEAGVIADVDTAVRG